MAETILYGIPNCDTVKKARKWLDAQGVDYRVSRLQEAGHRSGQAGDWIDAAGVDTVLNRRGTTFRKLSDADKADVDAAKAVRLLEDNPSMIKRPIVEDEGGLLVGFKEDEWSAHFSLILAALGAVPATAAAEGDFLVIAHRGASGERPEHTLAAYERAIDQGADYIEPDLVATKDMRLVARHETEIGETTDVGTREESMPTASAPRRSRGGCAGWFAEDFTLAELRSLRVKERLGLRPANARFDGLYQIPTFEEIVTLVRAKEAETGRAIGIYPELKHPTWLLQEEGIDTVDLLATALRKADLDDADDRVFVQVFEIGPLQRLDALVDSPLVLLIAVEGGPYDEPAIAWDDHDPQRAGDVAHLCRWHRPLSRAMSSMRTASPTALIADAHAAGLAVHPWTLRKENAFLPPALRRGTASSAGRSRRRLREWSWQQARTVSLPTIPRWCSARSGGDDVVQRQIAGQMQPLGGRKPMPRGSPIVEARFGRAGRPVPRA